MELGNPSIAVAYLRVSTDEQGLGLEAQRERIREWAAARDVDVVAWHTDEISGSCPVDDRTGFMEALSSVAEHKAGRLVVARRDRLARDVLISTVAEGMARRVGAGIVSTQGEGTDDSDPDNPTAMFIRQVLDVVAAYERGIIRMRVRDALRVLRDSGMRYGTIPYGMMLDPSDPDRKRLVTNQDEVATIARAAQLRQEGMTPKQIMEALTDEGFRSRKGTPLGVNQIKRMLED